MFQCINKKAEKVNKDTLHQTQYCFNGWIKKEQPNENIYDWTNDLQNQKIHYWSAEVFIVSKIMTNSNILPKPYITVTHRHNIKNYQRCSVFSSDCTESSRASIRVLESSQPGMMTFVIRGTRGQYLEALRMITTMTDTKENYSNCLFISPYITHSIIIMTAMRYQCSYISSHKLKRSSISRIGLMKENNSAELTNGKC